MAAPLPAPECVRIAIQQKLGNDNDVLNIFHVQVDGAGPYDPADLNALAHGMYTAFTNAFYPHLTTAISAVLATARDISVVDGADGIYVPGAPIVGSLATAPLTANTAVVVSWKEPISYRGGHPRTYLAGVDFASTVDPQHIVNSKANTLTADGLAFRTAVNALTPGGTIPTVKLVVVHYRLNDTVQTPPQVQHISSAVVDTRLDSQRRRLGS